MGRMLVTGKDGGGNNRTDDRDWTVVDHRRKKNTTIRGSKKNNDLSAVKGIGNTMDVYVGRCVKSVTEDALGKYIKDEASIDVVSCRCLSNDNSDIKSFKVTVAAKDRDALLDASIYGQKIFWLESILRSVIIMTGDNISNFFKYLLV